jgi:hypothetical protein
VTEPEAHRPRTARWRLAGIGLLAVGVTAALYAAGRLHQPDAGKPGYHDVRNAVVLPAP